MIFGAIKKQKIQSPLEGLAQVRPHSQMKQMMKLAAPLMLTSLVDAFAVIVIYLLVSTHQSGKELQIDRKIKLPQASKSQSLQPGVNVRVIGGKYLINEKEMNESELLEYLSKLHKEFEASSDERKGNILIQADKASDYSKVSPLLSIAAQTGFENIKFAVLGE